MITDHQIRTTALARGYPQPSDTEFWPKVAAIIDEEIEFNKDALKDWWLVHAVPLWRPSFTAIELNYLIAMQAYYLKQRKEKRERLGKALTEPYLGHTQETYDIALYNFMYDNIITGTWPIKCGHHIMKYEEHSGREIGEYDHIIEIGAGIGEMPRYCFDLGFKGTYTVLDLAPTCKIQQAYLKGLYPVTWVYDVAEITPKENTLVIAMWSLSEIPYAERERMCQHLVGHDWLIAFQGEVMGLYNVGWFPKLFASYARARVTFEAIPYHQYQGGSFYAYATHV